MEAFFVEFGGDSNQLNRYPLDLDKLISDPKMENILIINRGLAYEQAHNLQNVMNEQETITDRIEKYLSR